MGIRSDSPILIVAAMVVSPEFGPIAAACVAAVQRRRDLARRSLLALAVGFLPAIAISGVATAIFRAVGLAPDRVDVGHPLTAFIADPNFFSFFVAYLAGTAGMLSLTSAKSGALIGVLVSVTTIPAAANIGVALAVVNWPDVRGATAQLVVNLIADLPRRDRVALRPAPDLPGTTGSLRASAGRSSGDLTATAQPP